MTQWIVAKLLQIPTGFNSDSLSHTLARVSLTLLGKQLGNMSLQIFKKYASADQIQTGHSKLEGTEGEIGEKKDTEKVWQLSSNCYLHINRSNVIQVTGVEIEFEDPRENVLKPGVGLILRQTQHEQTKMAYNYG